LPITPANAATGGLSSARSITAVAAGLAFPHAAQAIQVVRRRRRRGTKKGSRETVYAITSLTAAQASPAGLAAIIPGTG
jgi:hypothetical protein